MSDIIGNRIKSIRLSLGLTMEEFGKLFDVAALKSNVSGWERGNHLPNANRLKKIAELGDISVDELIRESYDFSNYLKSMRKDRMLTLKELADKSGTSDLYLSQLENGRRNPPKPKMLKSIANSLSNDFEEAISIYKKLSELAGYSLSDEERTYADLCCRAGYAGSSERKEKEDRSNGMLLKDLIEKIGFSVDEFKAEALPMLAEAYESMSKISQQKEIIEIMHGKHKNKKEIEK